MSYKCFLCGLDTPNQDRRALITAVDGHLFWKENTKSTTRSVTEIVVEDGQAVNSRTNGHEKFKEVLNTKASECIHCGALHLWKNGAVVFPHFRGNGLSASPNLDPVAAQAFEKAATNPEPEAALFLARKAAELHVASLAGESSDGFFKNIGKIANTYPNFTKGFDVIRYYGNEAVHADPNTDVAILLTFLNITADAIAGFNSIDRAYDSIPTAKRNAIETRNGQFKQ